MKLNDPFVITISREIGSGGRTVGRKLAQKLGVHYSDKQLIEELERKLAIDSVKIEELRGKKKNWLSDFLEMVAPVPKANTLVGSSEYTQEFTPQVSVKTVFDAEKEILNAIADEGSCVIAGRSGFFVLKDRPNKVDIFITASRESRIQRIRQKQKLSEKMAQEIVDSVDKTRENYVMRYTGQSRYDLRNYNLVINMEGKTEDEAVDIILSYIS
ncbi:MAG: cytidylate kinase-like family protein [Bacteroidaceae bacterium]|nr:cytidylate kinase-like family protein [Bacteroidaceae bacterium]